MLIQKGAKVNPIIQSTGSFNGMTPVDFASRQNELKTVALLRIHGGMTGEELKVFKDFNDICQKINRDEISSRFISSNSYNELKGKLLLNRM